MKTNKENFNNSSVASNNKSVNNQRIAIPRISSWNPGLAAALSLIVPGAGQMYGGRMFSGLKWFVLVSLGYLLFVVLGVVFHTLWVIPGMVLHTISVVRATNRAKAGENDEFRFFNKK